LYNLSHAYQSRWKVLSETANEDYCIEEPVAWVQPAYADEDDDKGESDETQSTDQEGSDIEYVPLHTNLAEEQSTSE